MVHHLRSIRLIFIDRLLFTLIHVKSISKYQPTIDISIGGIIFVIHHHVRFHDNAILR